MTLQEHWAFTKQHPIRALTWLAVGVGMGALVRWALPDWMVNPIIVLLVACIVWLCSKE